MNRKNSSRILGTLGGTLCAIPLATIAAASCYVLVERVCCAPQGHHCEYGGELWIGWETTTPVNINTARIAVYPEQGSTGFSSSFAGHCNRTLVSCGTFPGECVAGETITTSCNTTNLTGENCTGVGDP
jgi:hypothetical protein